MDSKVRQAYYRLLLTRDEIASRDELLAYFRAKMDRVQTRLDAGLARPVELHEAELEVFRGTVAHQQPPAHVARPASKALHRDRPRGQTLAPQHRNRRPALRTTPATRPQRSRPTRPHRRSPRQPAPPRRTRLANRPTAAPSAQRVLAVAPSRRPATNQGHPRHRPRLELERQRPNVEGSGFPVAARSPAKA